MKPQVASAAVAAATVPSSKSSSSPSDYDTIFNIIYNGIEIKLLPNTANDPESSVPNEPIQEKFNTIFDGLNIILPKEKRKDQTNFVAAAAVAVAAQSKSSSVDRETKNSKTQTDPNTHEILRHLPLYDQLYLYTKLLTNCVYISDYDIEKLLNDIIEQNQSEEFLYDKSKHELADKLEIILLIILSNEIIFIY